MEAQNQPHKCGNLEKQDVGSIAHCEKDEREEVGSTARAVFSQMKIEVMDLTNSKFQTMSRVKPTISKV